VNIEDDSSIKPENPGNLKYILVLSLSLVATSCAASHTVRTLDSGISVHTFRRDYTNAHVVTDGEHSFMVDAGFETNGPQLARDIREAGLDPAALGAIVLSHGHADHAGGARYFQDQFGTPIVAARAERAMLASGENDRLCPTDRAAERRLEQDQSAIYTPLHADVWVEEVVPLAALTGIEGQIRLVPGHTAGSLVVVAHEAAFVGDMFRGTLVGEEAHEHFYMCDREANLRALELWLEGPGVSTETFFVGHFGPISRRSVEHKLLVD